MSISKEEARILLKGLIVKAFNVSALTASELELKHKLECYIQEKAE